MSFRFFNSTELQNYTNLIVTKVKALIAPKADKATTLSGYGIGDAYTKTETDAKIKSDGGKINVIKVNGTAQDILSTDKSVNITVPTKTSQVTNDSGFITSSDIPEGAAASTTVPLMDGTATVGKEMAFARGDHVHPTDTTRAAKTDVDALTKRVTTAEGNISTIQAAGYQTGAQVNTAISTHDASTKAHSDIREAISTLQTRLNTVADSDDTTLDQLSEIVAYIKNNKSLIDGVTTSKVNNSDMVVWTDDELTSIVNAAFNPAS